MYNQNMQQTKKKNIFQTALIFVIVGALLVIAGGTANTIHRNISLGRFAQTHEEYLKEQKELNEKYSNTDDEKKRDEIYYKEVLEPNMNNAKTAQVYNIIGLIFSVISVCGLITFMFLRNKKMFITGYYFSIGCLVLTANIFYEIFSGTFINFHEHETNYIYSIASYGKTAIFVHPWLRLLYITLSLAGWVMIFIAFRSVKKNADTIITEAQQAKQMKAQQMQQQQYTQAPQPVQQQYTQAPQQMQQQQYTQAPQQMQQQQYTQAPQQMQQQQYTQAPQQGQPQQPENTQQQQ